MRRVALALILLVLLACGQEPTAIGPNGPEFDWMNNPDIGNLRVTRYGATDFAVSWTDPSTGLRATHMTFPLLATCGPQVVLDPLSAQDIGIAAFQ